MLALILHSERRILEKISITRNKFVQPLNKNPEILGKILILGEILRWKPI